MTDKRKIKGEQTRNSIIDAAALLIQKQGYAATSLSQLIKESGQPKGSIYFHFPGGKREIALAAATKNADQISMLIGYVFETSNSLYDAVTLICSEFSQRLKQTNYSEGCPMSPLASSTSEESQELRDLCGKAYENWLIVIENGIQNYSDANDEQDYSALASLVLSAIEGAILLSQGRRNTHALELLPQSLKGII